MGLLGELMLDSIWIKGFVGVFVGLEALAIIVVIAICISNWLSKRKIDGKSE